MAKCIIFGAAAFDGPIPSIENTDLVIAADGGLRHFTDATRQPDVILGDFDSLGYIPQGAQVFPVEKDDTDSMLAIKKGLELGFREFLLYGSLDGPRLDHTVANFQTLQFLADRGAKGYLIGNTHIVKEHLLFLGLKLSNFSLNSSTNRDNLTLFSPSNFAYSLIEWIFINIRSNVILTNICSINNRLNCK